MNACECKSARRIGRWVPMTAVVLSVAALLLTSCWNPMNSAGGAPPEYTLTLKSGGNGNVTPADPIKVQKGNATKIEASPSAGYTFVGWSAPDKGVTVANPTNASTTVTLASGDATVTANFQISQYILTLQAAGGGGTVSPSGQTNVSPGARTQITATPSGGYTFSGWSSTDASVQIADPSSTTTSVVLTSGNATVSAGFTAGKDTLTVTSGGHGSVMPNGATAVTQGQPVTITATPAGGYVFTKWTTDSSSVQFANPASSTTTVTLTGGSATVTANFAAVNLTLTVTSGGGGMVSPSGSVPAVKGQAVAITATPSTGYVFSGWTASGSGVTFGDVTSASTTATVTASGVTVTANFTLSSHTLTVDAAIGGAVSQSGAQKVSNGAATPITASANAGYTFVKWTASSLAVTIANPTIASTTATLANGDATVTANFEMDTYTLTVQSGANGTVNRSGTQSVNYGAATQITAAPTPGYIFGSWSSTNSGVTFADATSASTTVTLTGGNATVTASFIPSTHQLSLVAGKGGTVFPTSTQTVNYGTPTTIAATSNAGYTFVDWTTSNTGVTIADPNNPSTTATLTGGNATLTANFQIDTYTLTLETSGNGVVNQTGPLSVDYGAATPISATPNAGYAFAGWTVPTGVGVTFGDPTSASTAVTLTGGSATIEATFARAVYNLTVLTAGGTGTTTPAGLTKVDSGVAATISATAGTGYGFVSWTTFGGGVTVAAPTSATTTATLTSGDATVTANFAPITYTLTVTNTIGGSAGPSGGVSVGYGQATTITATADKGYAFVNWTVPSGGATIADTSSASTTVALAENATVQANFAPITYNLTVQSSSASEGSVSPNGTVAVSYGEATTISATAATGYAFKGWTVPTGTVSFGNSNVATTSVALTSGDATVQANFMPASNTLVVQAASGGTVSPSGPQTVTFGSPTSVSATADAGYSFAGWTVLSGSAAISNISAADTTVTLSSGDATVEATFAPITYQLVVESVNSDEGSVSPNGQVTVDYGAATTISATPASGYVFSGWSAVSGTASFGNASTATTAVTLMSGDATVAASFLPATYTLTVDAGSGGSVTPSGAQRVSNGTPTAISAAPSTGYTFAGWNVTSGTATITSPLSKNTTVTLTSGDATVTADFTQITYDLTVQSGGGGTVSPSGTEAVNYGAPTTISATPASGMLFTGWRVSNGGGVTFGNQASATTTVTLTGGDAVITANFESVTFTLTVAADNGGSATPSGSETVSYNVATTINATPNTGYTFAAWTVTNGTATIVDPSAASTTVTLASGDATVTASFAVASYTLTVDAGSGGTVSPSGSQTVEYGATTQITATPSAGYAFANWSSSDSGVTFGNAGSANTTVTLTGGTATVTANFQIDTYSLAAESANTNAGTVSPSSIQSVDYGVATAISATPATGYSFAGWSVGSGTGVSFSDASSASTTVTLTESDATIVANFAVQTFTLTTLAGSGGWVTPNTAQVVSYGAATQITATPSAGYTFEGWIVTSGSGVTLAAASSANTTVTLTGGNATIEATFGQATYTLTVNAGSGGTVSPSGQQTVDYGVATPITASPNANFNFAGWTANSTGVTFGDASSASTTVSLTGGDATVTANFSPGTVTLTVNAGSGGSVTPSGSQTVTIGAAISISATASTGYTFTGWSTSGGASVASTGSTSTTVTLSSNGSVTATFAPNAYTVTVSGMGASVTPGGALTENYGSQFTVTAGGWNPRTGGFSGWSSTGGVTLSNEVTTGGSATCTVTVTGDGTVTATAY